jgi:hypothetical protein
MPTLTLHDLAHAEDIAQLICGHRWAALCMLSQMHSASSAALPPCALELGCKGVLCCWLGHPHSVPVEIRPFNVTTEASEQHC